MEKYANTKKKSYKIRGTEGCRNFLGQFQRRFESPIKAFGTKGK